MDYAFAPLYFFLLLTGLTFVILGGILFKEWFDKWRWDEGSPDIREWLDTL